MVSAEPKISGEGETALSSVAQKGQDVGWGRNYIVFCAEKLRSISRLLGMSTCPNLNPVTGLDETLIQDKSAPITNPTVESAPDSELSLAVYSVDKYSQRCFETNFISCLDHILSFH